MAGNWTWDPLNFPNLSIQNSRKTSRRSRRYNCIAWAAGIVTQFWWPDPIAVANKEAFWPEGVALDTTIDSFIAAYTTLGFVPCAGFIQEVGFEKIAIYGTVNDRGGIEPTHAARQLSDGNWSSKLGRNVDIEHTTLDAVSGPLYGTAVRFVKRPI
jgi:hypothetical protein